MTGTGSVEALVADLVDIVGEDEVSVDELVRRRASTDGADMSPLIAAQLPLGLADVVVTPTRADDVPAIVSAAVRHGVPITPRGRGTGNYGQGIPLRGGLVIDTRRLTAVVEVAEGRVTAEAGARLMDLDARARATGQELTLIPSTVQSALGGFLAGGSGGAGTIAFGNTRQGFVLALDVVHATEDARVIHLEGDDVLPYLHSFGVVGIILRATVALHPLPDWRAVYASFDSLAAATAAFRPLGALDPAPKLVSADDAEIAESLPADGALPAGRASLRTIVDAAALDAALDAIRAAGGTVEEVREGIADVMRTSMLAYNHPAWWFLKRSGGRHFHLEVFGAELLEDPDRIRALFPEAHLHVELGHSVDFGSILLPYSRPEDVDAALDVLARGGVRAHNCHSWTVDVRPEELRELARTTDPAGLLNPGKLPEPVR